MLKPILFSALLAIPCVLGNATRGQTNPPTTAAAPVAKPHIGKVVSVAEGNLVMADKDGKNQHTHAITATAKITLDGKAAKLIDLKPGDTVRVTMTSEGIVTVVDATRAAAASIR